jgi:hypothetical protein
MFRDEMTLVDYDTTDTVLSELAGKLVSTAGSMFVWIPRYSYNLDANKKIAGVSDGYIHSATSGSDSGQNNKKVYTEIKWSTGTVDNATYKFPVFSETDLKGFWIAKFEPSQNGSNIRIVPDKPSLGDLTLDEMYNYSKDMINSNSSYYQVDEDRINSHLLKSSEWAAVAFLTNGTTDGGSTFTGAVPYPNNYYINKTPKTGYSGSKQDSATSTSVGSVYLWNTAQGQKASTTHNVYGVYDMSGGTSEYVFGTTILGSALEEVRINDISTWYNGSYVNLNKDYIIRGGIDRGLFTTSDIGMFDVSTRGVLVKK